MKLSSETLQNLPYFWNMKPHVVFFSFFISGYFIVFPNECPGLCQQRPGAFIKEKYRVARNEKRKKLHGFSYDKNIANFEAFYREKNFSKTLLFMRSVYYVLLTYMVRGNFYAKR